MADALFAMVLLHTGMVLAWGLRNRGRMYEFPFLANAVFAGWALPQVTGLYLFSDSLPPGSLEALLLMSLLCMAAISLGDASAKKPLRITASAMDENVLMWVATVFCAIGGGFYVAVLSMGEYESAEGGGLTGIATIYLFFAKLLPIGFAISMLFYLRGGKRWASWLVMLSLLFYFYAIVLAGRRAHMVTFALVLLLAYWFVKRRAVPRLFMLTVLVLGAFIVAAIGQYRAVLTAAEGLGQISWGDLLELDLFGAMTETVFRGEELLNAARDIYVVDRHLAFDYGLSQWNNLVFSFVPAQFLGAEFKQALMINLENEALLRDAYLPVQGTTHTGMADAFASFWYLGAGLFWGIGYLFAALYRGALAGHMGAQIVLMSLTTAGLHSITHGTKWFVAELVYLIIFLGPVLIIARKRRSAEEPTLQIGQVGPTPQSTH